MDPLLIVLAQWSFGLLFAAGLWHKVKDWRGFKAAVADYRLMPRSINPALATLIAGLEAATIAALVLAPVSLGLPAAALLQLLYALAMAFNLIRGRGYIACGCGTGAGQETISWALVVRNIVLSVVALVLATTPGMQRALIWLDWVSAVAALGTLVMLFAMFNVILSQSHGKGSAR